MTGLPSLDLKSLRVDQVGSLLRPSRLKEVFAKHGRGEASDGELRRVQDESIREVIAKQEAHNLPILTDGEFRRTSFMESFSVVAGGGGWQNGHEHPRQISAEQVIEPFV